VLGSRRWPTPLSREQFKKVTGAEDYPDFLKRDVRDDALQVYANAEINYRLRHVHAKVSALWDFEAPSGGGDTHFSILRGTKCNLVIRQSAEQKFRPTLYVEKTGETEDATFETILRSAIEIIRSKYADIDVQSDKNRWRIVVPERYEVGHEAHFAQVTEDFLKYLREGDLPVWEVPNLLTKYATMMAAYELCQ